MSHTVGTTKVEEDISKNAEKIAHSVMTVKSEETVMEDKEKEADPAKTLKSEETVKEDKEKEADLVMTVNFEEINYPPHLQLRVSAPEKSTNTGCNLLEPEQSKDEGALMWYNVRFWPGINHEEQSDLLIATLTSDIPRYLPNIEDDSIMEVFMSKEDAVRIAGLDEVDSVEPFLGEHKFTLLSPPGPEAGYKVGVLWYPFGYI